MALLQNKFNLYVFVLAVCNLCLHSTALSQKLSKSDFDHNIEVILDYWKAPGVIVTIVKSNDVLLSKGYGVTKAEGDIPVSSQTLTTVASVTKTFNSVALAMLVDDGKIGWDDPVKKYIPEFNFADAYRSDHTTIRDLITHRSGLPGIIGGLFRAENTISQIIELLPQAEPQIDFRERVDYSQVGIALLGEIVYRATGSVWPDFVKNRVLRPLKMNHTFPSTETFLNSYPEPSELNNLMGRAKRGENSIVNGKWRGCAPPYSAAAGIVTTGDDMANYLSFLVNEGFYKGLNLLSKERIQELHSPQEVEGSPYGPVINPNAKIIAYCLGWIAHEYEGQKVVEHPGSGFGSSVVALIPSERVGVFVSTNGNFSLDSDRMVSAIKFMAFDYVLGLESKDWISLMSKKK